MKVSDFPLGGVTRTVSGRQMMTVAPDGPSGGGPTTKLRQEMPFKTDAGSVRRPFERDTLEWPSSLVRRRTLVGDGAEAAGRDLRRVFRQHPAGVTRLGRRPRSASARDFRLGHAQVEDPLVRVDSDRLALMDQRDP